MGERGRDGVWKGLSWMGHNKLIRWELPNAFKLMKNSLKFCLNAPGKKSEISK